MGIIFNKTNRRKKRRKEIRGDKQSVKRRKEKWKYYTLDG